MLAVAAVTVADGGDDIGVYVPVFAAAAPAGLTVYCVVFLVLVAVWCAVGRFLATRAPVARALSRWGHVLLPVVLLVLVEGGTFVCDGPGSHSRSAGVRSRRVRRRTAPRR